MTGRRSRSGSEVVLIVEDDRINRKLMETVLSPHGYALLFAENGQEAIEVASEEQPDLVLMDMKLPEISGAEAARALKSQPDTADIPIVALTAYVVGHERRRAAEAGCDGYITKPIDTRTLGNELQEFMG